MQETLITCQVQLQLIRFSAGVSHRAGTSNLIYSQLTNRVLPGLTLAWGWPAYRAIVTLTGMVRFLKLPSGAVVNVTLVR